MKRTSATVLMPEIIRGWEISQHDSGARLAHSGSGTAFEINEITQRILARCNGSRNVASIISDLTQEFPTASDGERAEIGQDVKNLLHDLAVKGAIRFVQLTTSSPSIKYAPPAKAQEQAKLCIGMATFDDYDGVYFSIQALRLYHPEVLPEVEFVILDNNPTGACAAALSRLAKSMPNCRYVAGDNFSGTWSRFDLVHHTRAPYMMCIDSHVLVEAGAIKRLIDYFDKSDDSPDLVQGPLVWDNLNSLSTHFVPGWGAGMYGTWGHDSRADDPNHPGFDIPMQGLGLFAARRDHWPKPNPRFKGFGGEEGYLHKKVRRSGGRTLCLPFLRWVHRFDRPMGAHYALNWSDRIRNYMIGHEELGTDNQEMIDHFTSTIGAEETQTIVAEIRQELDGPFNFFDAIFCINLDAQPERWVAASKQFETLGISHRVQRVSAIETPESHHLGCTLSHHEIIQLAALKGYQNILVLEDDVEFDVDTLDHLAKSIAQVENLHWDLLYLGGYCGDRSFSLKSGAEHLREVASNQPGPTCTHAIAYNHRAYLPILNELPDSIDRMRDFLATQTPAIDQYLASKPSLIKLLVEPVVASQAFLLEQEADSFNSLLASETQ